MIVLKIFLWILLAVTVLLGLLLSLKYKIILKYKDEFKVYIKIGIIKLDVLKLAGGKKNKKPKIIKFTGDFSALDGKTEKGKNKPDKDKSKEQVKAVPSAKNTEKRKRSVTETMNMFKSIIADSAASFSKSAVIEVVRLRAVAAADSPDKTAIMFAEMNIAAAAIMASCDSFKMLKSHKANIGVYSDFTADKPSFDAEISLYMHGIKIVSWLVTTLKSYLNNKR